MTFLEKKQRPFARGEKTCPPHKNCGDTYDPEQFWFTAGYNARLRFQDSEPPIVFNCEERDHWRRGYKACEAENFSGGGAPDE